MKEPRKVAVRASLSPPVCKWGYPEIQLEDELSPSMFAAFKVWMHGQTYSSCDGWEYSHELGKSLPTGCGPHGYVYYESDVQRFLQGLPVID